MLRLTCGMNIAPDPKSLPQDSLLSAEANQAAPMNVDFKKIKLQFNVNVIFELK